MMNSNTTARENPSYHPTQCPACGRFTEVNPDGYWDRGEKHDDPSCPQDEGCVCSASSAFVEAFCNEACADQFHGRQPAAPLAMLESL